MSILNKGNFPYINTDLPGHRKIDYREYTIYWRLRDWSDKDYWYCEIFKGNAFSNFCIEHFVPKKILKRIKKDQTTFLCVCNAHESFHSIVLPLYQDLVLKSNLPPEKIILISESADLHLQVKKIANVLGLKPMNVEWSLIFEKNVQKESLDINVIESRSINIPQKKFLNLNRRWRLHRPTLVALMASEDLFEHGYISLAKSDDSMSWNKCMPIIMDYHSVDKEIFDKISKVKDQLISLKDMYIDNKDLVSNKVGLGRDLIPFYQNTVFSIVTETNFYTDKGWESARFLSEKTFKPIAFRHPFILVSVPHCLSLLRELGYRSFHPFIDEDYDKELNDFNRMKKILAEIKRLSLMSNEELEIFRKNVSPIVEHNYRCLQSRKTHLYNRDII